MSNKINQILGKYGITLSLKEILQRWNESHRGYHNIEHLKDLLRQIGKINSKEKELLVLISLFHDIIYEPKNSDNEEQSAKFLINNVKEVTEDIKKVYQSIIDTKTHKSSNELSEIFNKMDMNIVTRNFDELLKWEQGIRKEYSVFSDEDYKKGRIKFLTSLLNDYPENKENLMKLIDYVGGLNEGLSDKIKSRAKQQEIQLKQYIDNIDINSYFEDSPTIKEENYNKLKKLINNFPNEDLIYKILKDTDKKYRKQINYLFEEFAYIIGAEKIQEFIIYFINEMKDDLNNYSIDKITSRSIWSDLDNKLILNKLKKYKDSKLVDEIYNKNFRYYKKFKTINENLNLKSRASEQEKQMKQYVDNIDLKNLLENDLDSVKLRELLDKFPNQYMVDKIINDLPNELNRVLNYVIGRIYNYSDGENTLLKLINKLGDKLNKYGVGTLIDLTYSHSPIEFFPQLNKEKIYNEIKKYKGEEFFNDIFENNYYVRKEELDKWIKKQNEKKIKESLNLKSRASEQEKQREEYIKNILNKPIEDITYTDLKLLDDENIVSLFYKIKEKYGNEFDVFLLKSQIYWKKSYIKIYNKENEILNLTISPFNLLFKGNPINTIGHGLKLIKGNSLNESSESREEQFKIFAKKVAKKMGIPEPQYLDSGFFGSAFIIDNDRILKITTDKSEALNANKIKNKTTHFIAKVFDVRGFKFNDKEYFFIILEKVKTDFEFLYGIIENLISWFDENYDEDFVTYISEGEFKDLKQLENKLYNDNKQLYNFFTNFVELKKELMKYNITSADFINASNLGFRGKRVVAFDLGISDDNGDIENVDLFENLNLKSRASEQEKQRKKYINNILNNKNLEDLTSIDISNLKNLLSMDEFNDLIVGYLKTTIDKHFFGKEDYESKISTDAFGFDNLKMKFKSRNNLSNKINISIGFDNIKNKLYVHKFDGIGIDNGRYFNKLKELIDYVINDHRKPVYESLNLVSRANQQEEQRNDYIRKEGINDYTITFLYGKNHNDLPKDIQLMIFSFYENLMENLMRSDDNHWQRRVLKNEISRDIFKLLPDEFKSDIIDLRIDTDMGLDKNHFDSASNEQRDKYLNKAKEYRQIYTWEQKYLDSLNESLNLKSRANQQEKQRDEYVKNILKKDLFDLKPNDLDFLNNRKYRTLFNNKVKEYFYNIGFLFDDIDLTEDGNFPGLILKNGNEKYNNNLMFFLVNNGTIKVYKSDNILKFYDGKYFIRYVTNMLKNLDESLNLKSRANQQEKQKQEYINQILNGNSLEELTPEQRIKLLQIDWTVLKPLFVKIKEIYGERNKVYGSVDTVFDNKIYCHIGQNVSIKLSPTNGLFTVSWGLKKSDFKSFKGVLKKLEEIKSEYPFLIENFNLKSRAKDQEKQAIQYYTNKIKGGGG